MAPWVASRVGVIVRRNFCSRSHLVPLSLSSQCCQCRCISVHHYKRNLSDRLPSKRLHAYLHFRSILLFGDSSSREEQQLFERRPWHDPNFMKDEAPERVEAWLLSLLKSVSNNIHHREYSPSNPPVSVDDDFNLDATIYLRVLKAYANAESNYPGAPQKAEFWLNNAIRHYEVAKQFESSNLSESKYNAAVAIVNGLQPDVEFYNAAIECWANSKEEISVVRSRTLLSKLEDNSTSIQPNARSYDLYLHSVSRGIGKNAKLHLERAQEAEKILHYRLSSDAPTCIRPSTESFNYVLRAYTRCRDERSVAGKVMTLVREMEKIQKESVLAHLNSQDDTDDWKANVNPSTKTYTMAMGELFLAMKWMIISSAVFNVVLFIIRCMDH